jgi:hypothetical protein
MWEKGKTYDLVCQRCQHLKLHQLHRLDAVDARKLSSITQRHFEPEVPYRTTVRHAIY